MGQLIVNGVPLHDKEQEWRDKRQQANTEAIVEQLADEQHDKPAVRRANWLTAQQLSNWLGADYIDEEPNK